MHFNLNNSKVTSSEVVMPILPNIALAERKKDFWRDLYGTSKLSALCNVHYVFQKSDAKIQITITTAHLIRINYPLSSFNYRLSWHKHSKFQQNPPHSF